MKLSYFFILLSICLIACDDYDEHQPLDIVKGYEDLQQEYYKSILKNPSQISGTITDKKTKKPISKAVITLNHQNSTTHYSTVSKEDGSFSLYAEQYDEYSLYAEKDGYDKSYFSTLSSNGRDTVFVPSSTYYTSVELTPQSSNPVPVFKISYLTSIDSDMQNANDLSFNGTNIIITDPYNYYAYYFDANGVWVNYSSFPSGYYYAGCKSTEAFYAGTLSSTTIAVVNPKTGSITSTINCKIQASSLTDIEIFNSNLWIVNQTTLFKLSMTGELQGSFSFDGFEDIYSVIGLTQKNSFLYMLTQDSDQNYILYKIDPSTLKIVAKGILPYALSGSVFKGVAFDKTNLWTINGSSNYLIKLSVTE